MSLQANSQSDGAALDAGPSHNMFEALFANGPDPCFVLSDDGRICRANDAAGRMHGCPPEQLVGRNIADLDDPASAELAGERLARGLAGERLRFRVTHVLPDGSEIPLEVHLIPYDHGGETRLIAIDRDISARLKAEQIIARSAERPGLGLRRANQGIYDVDVQTGACEVNNEYATMLGYDPATFVETAQRWIDRLHPADQPTVAATYRDYVAGELPAYRVEFRLRMKDGRWKWVLSQGKIVEHDADGRPLRMVGTHTDITDIKAAQEVLRKDAERPRLALSSAKHGVWDLHIPSDQTQVSDEYAMMLGEDPASFRETNQTFLERIHPEDHQPTMARFRDYLSGKIDSFRVEFRARHRSGHWIWIQSVGKIIEWGELGQPVRVLGTCTDITEIKLAEMQLVSRQQHVAQMGRLSLASGLASAVAHELNQPLCAMVNYTASVERAFDAGPAWDEQTREDARLAKDAAQRAAQIIQRFRHLFDKHPIQTRPQHLPRLIDQCLELVKGELRQNTVRVTRRFAPGLPEVAVDPTLIQQVILNLTRNAVEAMAPMPADRRHLRFELEALRDSALVCLRVRDTGQGFSQDAIRNLFDAKPSDKPHGLGMGLHICRLIVKSHGGDIRLEHADAGGSAVAVRLPVSRAEHENGLL